jgi:uncharacterized protein
MIIGLDVDEVLCDIMTRVIQRHNEVYDDEKKYVKEDFHSYNWWEAWGGTREDSMKELYEFMASDYAEDVPVVKWSREGVERISEKNYLIGVTARLLDFRKETEKWLEKNFGEWIKEIYFCGDFEKKQGLSRKSEIVRKRGIELIVEDNFDYAAECAKVGVRVFLFNAPWNQALPPPGVERVYSWYDIVEKLDCAY